MVISMIFLLLISNHYRYPCYVEAIQHEKYDGDGCKNGRKRQKKNKHARLSLSNLQLLH